MQAVDDRRHRLRRRAHPVGVLDAQPKAAAVMAREQPIEQCGAGAADVQKPGRRGREADDVRSFPGGWGRTTRISTIGQLVVAKHLAQAGLH